MPIYPRVPVCAALCAHPRASPAPRPPQRGGCKAQARGFWRGKSPPAEGLNYFALRETRPRQPSAVDLGGKGPNPSWGAGWSRGCGASDDGAAACLKYTSKPPQPEQLFPAKISSVAAGGEAGASRPESQAPRRWVLRPFPALSGRVLAGSSKDAECWPRSNNEGTSQALLRGPNGLRGFSGPPGSVEIFEIHTVCPLLCVPTARRPGRSPAAAGWCPRLRALSAN